MSTQGMRPWQFALFITLTLAIAGTLSLADDDEQPSSGQAASDAAEDSDSSSDSKKEEEKDRYALPPGDDIDALLAHIEEVQNHQPTTVAEYFAHREKSPPAIKAAAEKVKKLAKPGSDAFKKAEGYLVESNARTIGEASKEQQQEILDRLLAHFKNKEELANGDLRLAMMVADSLEGSGNSKLAAQAYEGFAKVIAASDNEELAALASTFEGAARRVDLIGNEMKIEGTTVDGEEFDWESYRGKVVLIDFWATWCGPCVAEYPNIETNYKKYHDKGFDVVGISLDQRREPLEAYIKKNKVPWTTLHEEDGGGQHPTAQYYGIMGIPTMILVDRDGKVITLSARGEELNRRLEELLGKPESTDTKEAKES